MYKIKYTKLSNLRSESSNALRKLAIFTSSLSNYQMGNLPHRSLRMIEELVRSMFCCLLSQHRIIKRLHCLPQNKRDHSRHKQRSYTISFCSLLGAQASMSCSFIISLCLDSDIAFRFSAMISGCQHRRFRVSVTAFPYCVVM